MVEEVECQSNIRYMKDHTICTCSNKGRWLSEVCRRIIGTLKRSPPLLHGNMRSNVSCTPERLYLIDCNICKCDRTGHIQSKACTNRHCKTGTKADKCNYGDFLRTNNEICICSDVNYYIDKLCRKIDSRIVQELNITDAKVITNVNFKSNKCTAFKEYYIDCNHCICDEGGKLICTKKDCNKSNLRRLDSEVPTKLDLPTVHNENEVCISGQKYKLKCNTCICTPNEELSCTTMICLDDFVIDAGLKNFSNFHLPEIHEGQSCIAGHLYRLGCNTCRCLSNDALMCTKMACLEESYAKSLKKVHWRANETDAGLQRDIKTARSGQDLHGVVPKVARAASCTPGKITKKIFQEKSNVNVQSFPFKPEDIASFPVLYSLSDKCEPGKMYRIDCNGCLCQESNNLICEEKLCLSKKAFIKMEADRRSGTKCTKDETFGCVQCICVDRINKCKPIPKCEQREKLSGHAAKMLSALNPQKEKCTPGTMYTVQCNQCYCQPDSTLRCTQKACLNYAQAQKLEKQRLHLEKHGL
ncbi:unnamed protein product [Leptosia nina]|uniref:Pacifastin domain-containing protein n=1 Tax=Leptosia nina TaxID=320188 RepID=A0AAV1J4X8_9NEOP